MEVMLYVKRVFGGSQCVVGEGKVEVEEALKVKFAEIVCAVCLMRAPRQCQDPEIGFRTMDKLPLETLSSRLRSRVTAGT